MSSGAVSRRSHCQQHAQTKWGGPDNKRCLPTEVVANCDELRPPHAQLGRIALHTAREYSTALVVRMPGSMHYHTNFSLSAPLFRQAYANRQVRGVGAGGRECCGQLAQSTASD